MHCRAVINTSLLRVMFYHAVGIPKQDVADRTIGALLQIYEIEIARIRIDLPKCVRALPVNPEKNAIPDVYLQQQSCRYKCGTTDLIRRRNRFSVRQPIHDLQQEWHCPRNIQPPSPVCIPRANSHQVRP